MPKNKDEILDAEVVEEITNPDFSAVEAYNPKMKQPKWTKQSEFPDFTPETRETILSLVGDGLPDNHVCNEAGIRRERLCSWLEKGRLCQSKIDDGYADELYPVEIDFANFYTNYYRSKSSPVRMLLKTIMNAALGSPGDPDSGIPPTRPNPAMALKMLEKIDPEQFGQRQAIDMNVKGKVGVGHVHVNAGQLTDGGEIAKTLSMDELKLLKADIVKKTKAKQLVSGKSEEE